MYSSSCEWQANQEENEMQPMFFLRRYKCVKNKSYFKIDEYIIKISSKCKSMNLYHNRRLNQRTYTVAPR